LRTDGEWIGGLGDDDSNLLKILDVFYLDQSEKDFQLA
jgi:hypothetical protein